MRELVFQPILIRPGHSTRAGLAAHAARAAWLASRDWNPSVLSAWLRNRPVVAVRKASLRDFMAASDMDQWHGDSTAVAGPLMTRSKAPREFLQGKKDGWMPWGTADQPPAPVTIVINERLRYDHADICAVAAWLLLSETTYSGQNIRVAEEWLGRKDIIGDVLFG